MLQTLIGLLPRLEGLFAGGGWTYQRVEELDLVFERVWLPFEGRRIAGHLMEPNTCTFWHPHYQPIGVLVLGPGAYELRVGFGPEGAVDLGDQAGLLPRVTSSGTAVFYGPGLYALPKGAWHTIRSYGVCRTVALFGRDGDALSSAPVVGLPLDLDAARLGRAVESCVARSR